MAAKKPIAKQKRVPPKAASSEPEDVQQRIYAVVRAIPKGRVATYGQLAELAGIPRGHRVVAREMRTCPAGQPWYRVLSKKDARRAQIAVMDAQHAAEQRRRLLAEGVRFDAQGCIPLRDFGWLPSDLPIPRRKMRTR